MYGVVNRRHVDILPVLLYGLELILSQGPQLEQLEIAQKRLLKQILALPNSESTAK
jgi:hypothetical protein